LAETRMLPIALYMADPPSRTQDERSLSDHSVGDPDAARISNKPNNLLGNGSHPILTTISSLSSSCSPNFVYKLRTLALSNHGQKTNTRTRNSGHKDTRPMMMDMTTMSITMMVAAGLYHLAIFVFAVLGIAASIKYLRS
jgi:hypothetical protein